MSATELAFKSKEYKGLSVEEDAPQLGDFTIDPDVKSFEFKNHIQSRIDWALNNPDKWVPNDIAMKDHRKWFKEKYGTRF
jgi:hypothetical protein